MRKVLIILLIFLSLCSTQRIKKEKLWREDIIYTNEGEKYKCEILEITEDSIYAVTELGLVAFFRKDLISFDIAKKRREGLWVTSEDITDTLLKEALAIDMSGYEQMGYVNIWTKKKLTILTDSSYIYSIRIIRKVTSVKGRGAGTIIVNYRKNDEEIVISFARTVTDDGRVLHLREAAIGDISIYSQFPPYENLHERKFTMREVRLGNILDFNVIVSGKITDESPYIMDVTLGDSTPTLSGMIEVVAPRDFELSWQQWRIETPEIRRGYGIKILQWRVDDLPPLMLESDSVPTPYILPRVVVGLADGWEKVVKRFRENLRGDYTPQAISPKEIYEEVLSFVKFVEVPSFTISSYPENIKEIENNCIANSLDKAHLLYAAFRNAGYPVDLILVRSKERGVVAENVPSLFQFDGALVAVGETFLDPSSEDNPYGWVRPKYQGTKGLSIRRKGLVDIPFPKME